MAKNTMTKKLEQAKKEFQVKLKEIVDGLAELIPEGWFLSWHQSDQQYNDEDYYFGTDNEMLVSELEPRQGKLLKAEVKRVTEKRKSSYGGYMENFVTVYGSPAEYEWHLDDECEERESEPGWEEPGCIQLGDFDKDVALGLDKKIVDTLDSSFGQLDNEMLQLAFGKVANVTINSKGKCTVDEDADE